jgi:hypothetical protein
VTFILILILWDSLTFGGAPIPKLRRVQLPPQTISAPCPIDAKKRGLSCPE